MSRPSQPAADPVRGLGAAEVRERVEAGLVNRVTGRSSRSVGEIVRANLFTRFHALLGALLVVILAVGPLQDALFGLVIVANSAVGIVQELRAKRTLDRLSLLNAPSANVIREGTTRRIGAAELVRDDILVVGPGDQLVADALVVQADELEIDESLLTGEADPVVKRPGDALLSGSFAVAGSGLARATQVGGAAFAASLAAEARRFAPVHSRIRDDLDRLLKGITWVLVPVALLLVTTQLLNAQSVQDALRAAVAGVVGMVPEGLILLTSVAFATGIVRLGGKGVLVGELPAIEGLARIDTIGIDKTGTLTEGRMEVSELVPLSDGPEADAAAEALGALARADEHPNASLRALAAAFAAPEGWTIAERLAFSSARKWSAVSFAGRGTWLLGAPEMMLAPGAPALAEAERRARLGNRVMLLAKGTAPLMGEGIPPLVPVALIVLSERLRPDAAATLLYFAEEEIRVKVISGDSAHTAAAVAAALGLAGADRPVDGRELPEEAESLGACMEQGSVFGRVTPHQKRDMVRSLQRLGHVVAMVGDGVNDVLAIKEADIGVAMGSGTPAARGVAEIVLLRNRFDVMPEVVAEGRRIIANIERLANLFLTKTVYVALLAFAVGVAQLPFPFYPRHLTIISTLTIGVPAFFLALAPNRRSVRPDFLRRVLRFAIPAGAIAAAATFAAFAFATLGAGLMVEASRTVALIVLFGVGITVLALLILPLSRAEHLLLGGLIAAFAGLHASSAARSFFGIAPLPPAGWAGSAAFILAAGSALTVVWRVSIRAEEKGERGWSE